MGKGSRYGDGAPKSIIESGPAKGYTKIQVAPKVPNRIANLDQGIHMDPVLGSELTPGRRAGAKGVALGRGSFST